MALRDGGGWLAVGVILVACGSVEPLREEPTTLDSGGKTTATALGDHETGGGDAVVVSVNGAGTNGVAAGGTPERSNTTAGQSTATAGSDSSFSGSGSGGVAGAPGAAGFTDGFVTGGVAGVPIAGGIAGRLGTGGVMDVSAADGGMGGVMDASSAGRISGGGMDVSGAAGVAGDLSSAGSAGTNGWDGTFPRCAGLAETACSSIAACLPVFGTVFGNDTEEFLGCAGPMTIMGQMHCMGIYPGAIGDLMLVPNCAIHVATHACADLHSNCVPDNWEYVHSAPCTAELCNGE